MKNNVNWNLDMLASPPSHFPSNMDKHGNVSNIEDQALTDNKFFYLKSPQKIGKQVYISPLRLIQSPINSRLSPSLFDDIGLASMVSQGRSSVVNQKKPAFDRQLFGDEESCGQSQFNGNNQLTPIQESSNEKDFSGKQKLNKCKSQSDIHTTAKKVAQYATLQKRVTEQKKIRPRDKGLRRLSSRAYEIVQQMKTVTYKDVACKLVQQLFEQSELDGEGKDEQNIKRRVYDALNVLIALGILRKEGRKIAAEIKGKKKCNQLSTPQQHNMMMESYARQKQNVSFLKQKLADMKKKYTVIKNTIQRNKELKYSQDEIIRFPFIGAFVKNFNEEKMNYSSDSISLICDNKLRPFGDVDSLNLLEIYKEKKIKIEHIKKQDV